MEIWNSLEEIGKRAIIYEGIIYQEGAIKFADKD